MFYVLVLIILICFYTMENSIKYFCMSVLSKKSWMITIKQNSVSVAVCLYKYSV